MSSQNTQDDQNPYPWPAWGSQWTVPSDQPEKPLGWDDPYHPDPYARP